MCSPSVTPVKAAPPPVAPPPLADIKVADPYKLTANSDNSMTQAVRRVGFKSLRIDRAPAVNTGG